MRLFFLLIALVFLSGTARAQSYPSINLSTGVFSWEWATNGDPLGGFLITCTDIGPEGLPQQIKDVTNPAARSILLSLIPVINGTWSCVVQAYNDDDVSAESDPVIFKSQTCIFM